MDGSPIASTQAGADLSTATPRGPPTLTESERLNTLKQDIALHRYEVDAPAVAEAILSKLRLIKQGHQALAWSEADRTRRVFGSDPAPR